jgi:hypothetical protein
MAGRAGIKEVRGYASRKSHDISFCLHGGLTDQKPICNTRLGLELGYVKRLTTSMRLLYHSPKSCRTPSYGYWPNTIISTKNKDLRTHRPDNASP